jgi:hypothetical protein
VSARAILALALMLSGTPLAAAQPNIPSSEMPGRERERFIDPFPQHQRVDPVIAAPKQARPRAQRNCRVKGSKRRKGC